MTGTSVGLVVAALLVAPACGGGVSAYPDQFAGVGLELHAAADAVEVVRALPGGAADEAGVRAGDRVVAVDGVPVRGRALADVVQRLRGPAGSTVALVIERTDGRRTLALRRSELERSGQGGYRVGATP